MARRKRVVLEGPAAQAVERLARSAGVSPAELIKRALRREDEAQQAEKLPDDPGARFFRFLIQQNERKLKEMPGQLGRSGLFEDKELYAKDPEPVDDPVPYVPKERSAQSDTTTLGQLYMIYLDRHGIVYLRGLANSANFQKNPAPSAVDFNDLLQYLTNRPGDLVDKFINSDALKQQIPDPYAVEDIAAFHSRAEFFTIATTIDQYFKIAGFENTWEVTTSSESGRDTPTEEGEDHAGEAGSL